MLKTCNETPKEKTMRRIDLFRTLVAEDFLEYTAINVVTIHTIHLSMKIKNRDLDVINGFKDRLFQKSRMALWEETDDEFAFAFKITMSIHEYETGITLGVLGGCVPKTFRELIGE